MNEAAVREFDAAEYLDNEDAIAEYLNAALDELSEEGGLDGIFLALGNIAKARGMAEVAAKAGLGRESLYKSLQEGAHPRFETIAAVIHALGLRLEVKPESPAEIEAA
jgi:probable addiction module antidote protein